VSSDGKKKLAVTIANAYLPPKIASLAATGESRYAGAESDQIIDFIAVNEKKDPQPAPKMVKVTAQFVELAKNYGKVFAFKWAPLMGEDGSSISFGQTQSGNVTSTSKGTLSAAISGLFPKLNAAKSAGYARVIQSGMIITRDGKKASITKNTQTPFAVGTGDFSKATQSNVGLNMDVEPKILEQEKIEMALNFSVSLTVGNDAKVTTSNTISTNLVIKSKESAAIGGIVQNQSSTEYDKTDPAPSTATAGATAATPLFRLLRSKNYSTTKTQYVMFVTPEIIESASVGTEEIRKKFRRRE
jgi:pilus assembly protein CpaC